MKKYFPTLLLAVVLFAGRVQAADDIAFIDIQEVFKNFYKTQLAEDQIRQQADDIKLEREAMEAELKELREAVDTLRTVSRDEALSEDLRDSKREQLEEKLVELQKNEQEMVEFEKLRMQQIEQQNTRMSRKLFDEIHEAVIIYSKEMGYAGVIDRSAKGRIGMQIVLYADPKEDITIDVLAILNEGREKPVVEDAPAEEPSTDTEQ